MTDSHNNSCEDKSDVSSTTVISVMKLFSNGYANKTTYVEVLFPGQNITF